VNTPSIAHLIIQDGCRVSASSVAGSTGSRVLLQQRGELWQQRVSIADVVAPQQKHNDASACQQRSSNAHLSCFEGAQVAAIFMGSISLPVRLSLASNRIKPH
jgi:hypothetical protein